MPALSSHDDIMTNQLPYTVVEMAAVSPARLLTSRNNRDESTGYKGAVCIGMWWPFQIPMHKSS